MDNDFETFKFEIENKFVTNIDLGFLSIDWDMPNFYQREIKESMNEY